MMISFSISDFSLALTAPIQVGAFTLSTREGVRLIIRDEDGFTGIGECLPLPGLHQESVQECEAQLRTVLPKLSAHPIDYSKFSMTQSFLGLPFLGLMDGLNFDLTSEGIKLFPSVEFGIEQALLSLCIQRDSSILKRIFRQSEEKFSVPMNRLLIPNRDTLNHPQSVVDETLALGFTTLKVKVGRFSIEEEVLFLNQLTQLSQGKLTLRLDGNCLFDQKDYEKFTHSLDKSAVEYIEEPIKLELNSRSIYQHSPLPIALDESLASYLTELESSLPAQVQAIVVKPSTLGGIHRTVNLIHLANKMHLKCILSSAFDSGWSIATYALLSQLLHTKTAMGFDTYKYLETDVLRERLVERNGSLHVRKKVFTDDFKSISR